jgi:hypothetical protein
LSWRFLQADEHVIDVADIDAGVFGRNLVRTPPQRFPLCHERALFWVELFPALSLFGRQTFDIHVANVPRPSASRPRVN